MYYLKRPELFTYKYSNNLLNTATNTNEKNVYNSSEIYFSITNNLNLNRNELFDGKLIYKYS